MSAHCVRSHRRARRAAGGLGLLAAAAALLSGLAPPAAAAPGDETAPTRPAVTRFWLVNADTDTRIMEVGEAQILGLPLLPANLSIEAEANGATASVALSLNSGPAQVESNLPYALGGDNNGDFAPVPGLTTPGLLTVTAQPFAGDGGSGTAGTPVTIHLTALQPDFLVDDPKDVHDFSPGNGACETAPVVLPPPNLSSGGGSGGSGTIGGVTAQPELHGCTLRAAIEEANATPGVQSILVDGSKGPFLLSLGELSVTSSLTLAGHTSPLVDANNASRAFHIRGGDRDIQVRVAGLTVTRGNVLPADWGGNFRIGLRARVQIDRSVIREGRANFGGGAAVEPRAELRLTRSAVVANTAGSPENFGGGGITQLGGGIYNQGTTDIIESAIADNTAVRAGGLGNAGGTMRITNSSVVDNTASSFGGGITNTPNGPATGELQLTFSTVHRNESGVSPLDPGYLRVGGGVYNISRMSMASSVIAGNRDPFTADNTLHSPDCWAPQPTVITSYRYNTIGELTHTCVVADYLLGNGKYVDAGTSAAPINPLLGLRAGSGLRAYYTPQPGSPLIDSGAPVTAPVYPCPDHDQRAQARPAGKGCDRGAVERP